MRKQTWIVVTYPDGHHHVAPLFPALLDATSALDMARVTAWEEGRATHHCVEGDRILFAAVVSDNTIGAVQLTEAKRTIMDGSFTL